MMRINKLVFGIFVSIFSMFLFSNTAFATLFLNVSSSPTALVSGNITIMGSIVNDTSESYPIPWINVTSRMPSSGNGSQTSNTSFRYNITAPSTPGVYSLNITTNSSSLPNKTITVYVSNITGGSITYVSSFPPLSNGTNVTINITLKNGTAVVANYTPNVSIYQSNGAPMSWAIRNLTPYSNANGTIQYNITIPSNAAFGTYVIVVDGGAIISVFEVRSGYTLALQTLTTSDELTPNFAPGSAIKILSKVRTTTGSPVTGASVTAFITLPNSTVRNRTLAPHPSSDGYYNNTFNETSASGTYNVKVTATIGSVSLEGSATFSTKTFSARIEPQKKAFFEWAGQAAFRPGSTIVLDIISTNLTDGSTINQNNCAGTNTWLSITFLNGTSVNSSISNAAFASSNYLGTTNVCKVSFGGLTTSGTYNIRINVTNGGSTETSEGFFTVQSAFLKVISVFSLGGEADFMQVVSPGDNVTVALKAFNVTGNTQYLPQNITNFNVSKIIPLEFSSGSSAILGSNINQTSVAGVNPDTDPTVNLQLPSSIMGPLLIEIQADVPGENIRGTTFLIANYINGFVSPSMSFGGDFGPGAEMGASAKCSGNLTFSGVANDAKTGSAAQGATIISFVEAREDETGKDVTPYLSIAEAGVSNSNGQISVNVTFNPSGGYSFSGNYFVVFNTTYKGNSAGLPGFFQCKNLVTGFPTIQTIGSSGSSWQINPTAGLSISFTNVTNMSGSKINGSSVLSIANIFNFNPSSGSMQVLVNNTPMQATFNASGNGTNAQNNVTMNIYPQNYSIGGVPLTQWPNGFFDLRPRIVSNLGTDTAFGGFQVVAFTAFPETWGFGTAAAGSVQNIIIDAQADVGNATRNTYFNSTNNTAFTITVGRPWEGDMTTVTNINATMLSDGWNSSNTSSITGMPFERWNVSYIIPATVKKGGAQISISVNGTINNGTSYNQVDVPMWLTITKYNVIIPNQEGVGDPQSSFDNYGVDTNPGTANGWNFTFINASYGVNSSSKRVCLKSQFNITRYTNQGNQVIVSNASRKIAVMDRASPGVYDTVIIAGGKTNGNMINTSGEIVAILNATQRNMTVPDGNGGLYLWAIDNCGYFTMVNTTLAALRSPSGSFISNTWGGSHEANTNFSVPYVVILSNQMQSGITVSINGMGKQDNRGFGFESKLTSSNFTAVSRNTDSNGVAFVNFNVTPSGRFVAFWKVNSSSDSDTADMSSATFMEIRKFNTYGDAITASTVVKMTLFYDTTGGRGWGQTPPTSATYNASSGNTYVVYDATRGQAGISVSGTPPTSIGNINDSISVGSSSYTIAWVTNNVSSSATTSNNVTIVIYQSSPTASNPIIASTSTANITAEVCARTYGGNPPVPLPGSILNNLTVTDWSTFPAQTKKLTIYELMNHTDVTSTGVTTGPRGCALLNVAPGELSVWPSASSGKPPVFIEAIMTNSTNVERAYVADVFRP